MSLITCPECRNKISSSAKTCPNCGRNNNQISPKIFISAVIVFAVFFFAYPAIEKPTTKAKPPVSKKAKPVELSLPDVKSTRLIIRPYEFIGQPMNQIEFVFQSKANTAGHLTSQQDNYTIEFDSDKDNKISYLEITLDHGPTCTQDTSYTADNLLTALEIDKTKADYRQGEFGLKVYQHHPSTTKIVLGCFIDGNPYKLGVSGKYYLN